MMNWLKSKRVAELEAQVWDLQKEVKTTKGAAQQQALNQFRLYIQAVFGEAAAESITEKYLDQRGAEWFLLAEGNRQKILTAALKRMPADEFLELVKATFILK